MKVHEGDGQALSDLGELYRERGQAKLALKCFRKLVKMYPHVPLGFAQLASVYRDLDETDKAITAYERSIELDPNFSAALHNVALCYMAQQRYREAENYFLRALKSKDRFHQVRFKFWKT